MGIFPIRKPENEIQVLFMEYFSLDVLIAVMLPPKKEYENEVKEPFTL